MGVVNVGQYYYGVMRELDYKYVYVDTVDCGWKLMEHAYLFVPEILAVYKYLINNPCRVWWVGDYAKESELPETVFNIPRNKGLRHEMYKARELIKLKSVPKTPITVYNKYPMLINHALKQYINMEQYIKTYKNTTSDDRYIISPLQVLTAVGNGRGGGDYFGLHKDLAGKWAGCSLEVRKSVPKGYKTNTKNMLFVGGYKRLKVK